MPFVTIKIVREALGEDAEAKKQKAAKAIAAALAEAASVPLTDVWITFDVVAARDWYIGQDDVQSLRFNPD